MNARRFPAFEQSDAGGRIGLHVLDAAVHVAVQARHVDPAGFRPKILQPHERLRQQIDRTLAASAVKPEMQAGGEADQRLVQGFVRFVGGLPDLLQKLVTVEVGAPVEQPDGLLEL